MNGRSITNMILFIYFFIILILFKGAVEFGYIPECIGELTVYGSLIISLIVVLIISWHEQENEPDDRI